MSRDEVTSVTLRVVGVMSGTSLDGIDVAVVDVTLPPKAAHAGAPAKSEPGGSDRGAAGVESESKLTVSSDGGGGAGSGELTGAAGEEGVRLNLVGFETKEWERDERDRVMAVVSSETVSMKELGRLGFDLGRAFSRAITQTLDGMGVSPDSVDLVACHGQTVFHDPPYSTIQIGEACVIAQATGLTTCNNFRVADIAAGGQGAPLTSTLDWHALRPARGSVGWRAVQNIGGIANATLLPPLGDGGQPLAFDSGPGNVLMDMAAAAADSSLRYDRDGALAERGTVNDVLLATMLAHPYFAAELPKTTGRELFSHELFSQWETVASDSGCSPEDFVATLTELTAATIADCYKHCPGPLAEVVVGGGGARNPVLMKRLEFHVARVVGHDRVRVVTHEALGMDSDAKEAVAFALLGALCLTGRVANVPACTGATKEVVLGQITPGSNYARVLGAIR